MNEFLPGAAAPTHVVWIRCRAGKLGGYMVAAANAVDALRIVRKHIDLPVMGMEQYEAARHGTLLLPTLTDEIMRPRGAGVNV